MILKILFIGDPVLRKKAKRVEKINDEIKKLAEDMMETMKSADGVGLAAPQVGRSIRMIVVSYEEKDMVLINPEIIEKEGESIDIEGCLSVPGVEVPVKRAEKITLKFQNLKGKTQIIKAEGMWARIFQHEIDHLDGILIVDKIEESVKV
ncbi:MAG: peptide deformylase [Dictyoglomaceae bacterium]